MNKLILAALLCSTAAIAGDLPDPAKTPGATRTATQEEICQKGASKKARHVTEKTKRAVYAAYGMSAPHTGACAGPEGCEVDHLISLELGGSNAQTNLWPQPYAGAFNAHMKDRLENVLHRLVCSGQVPLATAQQAIASDWIGAYRQYVAGGAVLTAKARP